MRTIINFQWAIGVFLLGLCPIILPAQDAKEDLTRLYKNFDGLANLYFELENKVVKGNEVGLEQKGKIYKKGAYYYYQLDQYQVLVNQRYILVIDDQRKSIVCRDWNKDKAAQLQSQKMPSVEDIMERYATVTYKGQKDGYKQYTFENNREMIQKIDLFIDQESGFIKKAIYHYHSSSAAAGAQLQMSLPVIQTQPTFPKGLFSERQFIREQNGKLLPATRYAQYTIHDLRLPASK